MKRFKTILRFECMSYLRNRTFVVTTLLFVLVIAVVMNIPRISEAFGDKDPSDEGEKQVLLLYSEEEGYAEFARELFAQTFTEYDVRLFDGSADALKDKVENGETECAFVLKSPTAFTYYVKDAGLYDDKAMVAAGVLQNVYRLYAMQEGGLSPEQSLEILQTAVEPETVVLGKDQSANFFYTYVMLFALYMVIVLYGQMVATSVASEKSSRAMELLITSAPPTQMMFGKVLSACLAGLLQLTALFGSAFAFYRMNVSYWEDTPLIKDLFDIPAELLGWMLIFFVLGFLIYAFLFGAVGSMATKLEDLNTLTMPLTMLFVVGFFVVFTELMSGTTDSVMMKVWSFVPFTSPMAMFARIAMSSSVPLAQILLSIGILIGSVIGIGVLAAKIYRIGVLLYGTTPKLTSILKMLKNS